MSVNEDKPNRLPWPPIILATMLIIGIVMGLVFPARLFSGSTEDIAQGAGFALIVLGLVLVGLSAREMHRHKTTIHPTRSADHLVTTGPYKLSRNPIYLANVLLLAGAGLLFSNAWLLPLALVGGFLEQKFAIEPEEAHLERRFGKAFRDYRKRVRRWL